MSRSDNIPLTDEFYEAIRTIQEAASIWSEYLEDTGMNPSQQEQIDQANDVVWSYLIGERQ